jgi:hypothetical protein
MTKQTPITLGSNQPITRRVMSRFLPCILAAVMMSAVAPAFAGGQATQMWRCEMGDDATEEQVVKAAQKWLAAARKVKGGENLEASIFFPVAVNKNGETDMIFVVRAPSFKEWGKFWDGYADSPASKLDKENGDMIVPTDSALWEVINVKSSSAPKFAGKVTHVWRCAMGDDATEEQVIKAAEKWVAAAKTMSGGKNLEASVFFPIAVNNNGEIDMLFVINLPSFEEYGEFWDGFADSPVANLDKENGDIVIPTDSALWESIKVEVAE